eukprot:TRINITY_DN16378_c0_g1_i1.p1 TRINITY_DN16378_c0_g1~~TRINITY_DN16378_c0_g1_i1.p1  ORF type:complete len:887 (+),score=246.60 TRINITY_DN16378_c0_g1_i1:82-2661(+)
MATTMLMQPPLEERMPTAEDLLMNSTEIGIEESSPEGTVDAKTLANRRKKEKLKAKKAEKATTTPDGTEPTAAAEFTPPARGGKAEVKKDCAAARAAREHLEKMQEMERQKQAAEEEKQRLREEEELRIRLEKEAEEARRKQKADAKQAKVEKAKATGTYMTKAQKLKAAKAAHAREQLSRSPCFRPREAPVTVAEGQELKLAGLSDEEVDEVEDCGDRKDSGISLLTKSLSPQSTFARTISAGSCESLRSPKSRSRASTADWEREPAAPLKHRSPIVCIMGHVDVGKTKLLDRIRKSNVQEREAGGITQQIGATFFPRQALAPKTAQVDPTLDLCVPGLLIIDTPGHESFENLRSRGSSLCDIAVLVIDIMHGLEAQTLESLDMLRKQNVPFIIALNKVDAIYDWSSEQDACMRESLARQKDFVQDQFQRRLKSVILELNERGLNASLYWENKDPENCLSLVPTSARSGEGICDLLFAILSNSQSTLATQLERKEDLECTVMEVKHVDGLGTTVDVLLVNGTLKEGDRIVLAGLNGPIVTHVRALLTPPPMREMRVKSEHVHHTSISTSMGVKISAPGLEKAVCGSDVLVVHDDGELEDAKQKVQADYQSILAGFDKQAVGVCVKASTIGSLEALLAFLRAVNVPVSDMSIGEVHKKDVKQAAVMRERKQPQYAVILAFDVKVAADAKKEAKTAGVQIFTADIIYHLLDQFKLHMEKVGGQAKPPSRPPIFPCVLEARKICTVHADEPSLVWCNVVSGQLRKDTPVTAMEEPDVSLGCIVDILKDGQSVDIAHNGSRVCVKLKQPKPLKQDVDLEPGDQLCSTLCKESIETIREHFSSEMRHTDWALLDSLKKVLKLD